MIEAGVQRANNRVGSRSNQRRGNHRNRAGVVRQGQDVIPIMALKNMANSGNRDGGRDDVCP